MASWILIAFFLIFFGLSTTVISQDSCSSSLNINGQLPFDATSFNCKPVWAAHGYILRYSQTTPNLWSFVLSAPNTNSYVAMGFSPDGMMVGSSAIVGWIGNDGSAVMKMYALRGQTPSMVVPDQGNLQVLGNSSSILTESSRIYLAFQLSTNQPSNRLIYSIGPQGNLPLSPGFRLTQHDDMVSTTLNYVSGESQTQSGRPYSNLRKSHGTLNMVGWGILIPIGAMLARYLKQWDPIWFYSHIAVQSLGFILGLVGVICGFILNNRLNANVNKHKGLGIFILSLGCLQVMTFLARPDKTSKLRKYWNWYHYSVGRILINLAAVNVFYGIHLGKAGTGWTAGYGVVLGILFLVALVLELRMCMRK